MSNQDYGQGAGGQPPAPQYGQPAAPQYGQAPAPQYGQPAGPQYGQPTGPQYGQVVPKYGQDPYGQNPYGPGYVQQTTVIVGAPRTNTLSIVGFIVVWFVSIVGIILGHIALSQIKRSGEGGRGLALAAVIIGYVSLGLTILFVIGYIVFVLILLGTVATVGSSTYTS